MVDPMLVNFAAAAFQASEAQHEIAAAAFAAEIAHDRIEDDTGEIGEGVALAVEWHELTEAMDDGVGGGVLEYVMRSGGRG